MAAMMQVIMKAAIEAVKAMVKAITEVVDPTDSSVERSIAVCVGLKGG